MPRERASPFLMLLNAGALYVADGMGHHTQAPSSPRGCLALVGGDSGLLRPVQHCSPCSPKQLEAEAFAETPPLFIPTPTPRGEELKWPLLSWDESWLRSHISHRTHGRGVSAHMNLEHSK